MAKQFKARGIQVIAKRKLIRRARKAHKQLAALLPKLSNRIPPTQYAALAAAVQILSLLADYGVWDARIGL